MRVCAVFRMRVEGAGEVKRERGRRRGIRGMVGCWVFEGGGIGAFEEAREGLRGSMGGFGASQTVSQISQSYFEMFCVDLTVLEGD
jgi:hypothetical protein